MSARVFASQIRSCLLSTTYGRINRTALRQRVSYLSSTIDEPLGRNPGLESVISQGIQALERTAADIQQKTKKMSLAVDATGENAAINQGPNPRQLAEGQRIMDVAQDCLEDLCERRVGSMYLGGEPIIVVDVQVNSTAKLAKVYWTLPYSVLTDPRMTKNIYDKLVQKVRENVEDSGGSKLLSRQVHTRLRSYYPPRVKLVPATNQMIEQVLMEIMS